MLYGYLHNFSLKILIIFRCKFDSIFNFLSNEMRIGLHKLFIVIGAYVGN